ncbi:MAG: 16S rRNA (adenine(1518)-N(6)/adenine(1519)-N(6))-dimethyltransferase RsmA [Pseudomonadota bacterium]
MSHRPRKRFGQHFLTDTAVIDRLVAAIDPQPGQTVVEIGPGTGAMTVPLAARCDALTVVELDRDLARTLAERTGLGERLIVHNADALSFDFCSLASAGRRLRLTGNLPYNISTPLLFHLTTQLVCIDDMHFMLQREVVQRMAANAGDKHYGRLSIMLAQHCAVEALFDIAPDAFRPPPKVHSSFVRVTPLAAPPFAVHDQTLFAATVSQAFSMRRKTLRNALRGIATAAELEGLGLDPSARPETLPPASFAAIANLAADRRAGEAQASVEQ